MNVVFLLMVLVAGLLAISLINGPPASRTHP